jgi:hypothetical protein
MMESDGGAWRTYAGSESAGMGSAAGAGSISRRDPGCALAIGAMMTRRTATRRQSVIIDRCEWVREQEIDAL